MPDRVMREPGVGTEWKGCREVVWRLQGCLGVVGKSVELRLSMECKQALEKLLPYRSILCLLFSLSCGSFSSMEDGTGIRLSSTGLAKKEWGLW